MKKIKKFYKNHQWYEFSEKVKHRDNYTCLKCNRNNTEVILQVHHNTYYNKRKPWEYSLSDCLTLCKGCHAREHGLIEPTYGWTLISIDDLGDLTGLCERENCNTAIRYEHLAYHPQWGYKIVGSSCIDFLTESDKLKSKRYITLYTKIAKAFNKAQWEKSITKKSYRTFLLTTYQKSSIRIYTDNFHYQIGLYLGKDYTEWEKPYKLFQNMDSSKLKYIKELSLIHLMGVIASERDKHENHEAYREIYRNIRKSIITP